MRKRLIYSGLFAAFLAVEIYIGACVRDALVRPYVGDALVIVLLCCLARVFFPERPRLLGVYMIGAGVLAEVLQGIGLDRLLGAEGTWLGTALGSTFDWRDLLCYAVGGVLFTAGELLLRRKDGNGA